MKKRIFSLFIAYAILFSCLVPALVSAEETTETKTAFTVEELLKIGFVSSVDFTDIDLQNIYNISINPTIENFDDTIIVRSYQPTNYYYVYNDEVKNGAYSYPLIIMPKYYVTSDERYTYYSNYSASSSYYPFTNFDSRYVISSSRDFSSASTMKNIIESDLIVVFRQHKTTNKVDRFLARYNYYQYYNCSSVSDLFNTEHFNPDSFSNSQILYYCITRQDNSTSSTIGPDIWAPAVGIKIIDVDVSSFTEWIIENKRYQDILDCGLNVAQDKINYLVDWWSHYSNSTLSMVLHLPQLVANINIVDIDISLISSVCSCIDNLYIEYKNYLADMERKKIQYDHSYWPGHLTDDNGDKDYTYVTDTDEDDVYTSLLREILRTISTLPDLIATKISYIQTYLDAILIDFNRLLAYIDSLPDYLATSIYNMFVEPLNMIFLALDNLEIDKSTSVEVIIPEQKQDELNIFFSDWHTTITDKLSNKFPLYTQLSELFNDEFFEKCGLDVNGDGETYSYYSSVPGAVASSASASETSVESVAINSLLKQFDNADSTYLDNVIYSEDIPDGWTVKVAGKDLAIFDFRLYAKYRYKIHAIMTLIIYTVYLLSLFKSLPTIVGNVADVSQAFSDAKAQKDDQKE